MEQIATWFSDDAPIETHPLQGNQLWKLRTKHGRNRLFSDALALYTEARRYFEWCDKNPRAKAEIVKSKLEWDDIDVPLKRPYLMTGLGTYLFVSANYFPQVERELTDKLDGGIITASEADLLGVIRWIRQTVFNEQLEGALTGQYNALIIARLNGMADTINNNNTGDPTLKIVVRDEGTAANMNKLKSLL